MPRDFVQEALAELEKADQAFQAMMVGVEGIPDWTNREEVTMDYHMDRAGILSRLALATTPPAYVIEATHG